LDRLATVEGKLSPAQQKVPQLPALFKPHGIRALGSKTDPKHPMDGYMVGDSVEPRRTALEEAMAEIEEDMLSKVKRDLTHYLDRLEKKVSINRDLKDKAKDAVKKRQPEEIEEFAPVGGDDREPDDEEILRQLAAQWWNGTEQQMAKAQRTLAAMGWEIGPDESGDDDAGVYVYRIGDEDGRDTIPFAHSDLDILDEVDFSGGAPTQAQTDTFNAVNAAAGPAVNQMTQAGEKWQAGNKFGAAVDAAKSVNNIANAAGATFGDKVAGVGSALKAGGNAALAYMRGKDPAVAAAGSVASDLTQPVADYTNSENFASDFHAGMSNGGNPANPLQKAYDNNLVNADSVRNATNSMNKTANQLKSGDASAMQNFQAPSLYRDDQTPYLDINKRNVITQKPVQTKAEIQDANPISGVTSAPTTPAPKTTTPTPAPAAPTPTPAPKATTTPAPAAPTPAPKATTTTPAATFEMADGKSMDCYGDDNQGYELRHGERTLPSRFKNLDHAGMAVKLYQARKRQQQPKQDLGQDYIEER